MPENNTEHSPSFDDTYQAVHHLAEVAAQAEQDLKEGKEVDMSQLLNNVQAFSKENIPEARDILVDMEAADVTRARTMAALSPQLRMSAENYSQGIKDWNKLLMIKDEAERKEAMKTMPKNEQERIRDAVMLRDVMHKLDEELRTEMAEKEVYAKNLERELFADLEGTIEEEGKEAIEYGNQGIA